MCVYALLIDEYVPIWHTRAVNFVSLYKLIDVDIYLFVVVLCVKFFF